MASIRYRQRRDGTVAWQVMFRDHGRQQSRTFPSEAGATRAQRLIDDLGVTAALEVIDSRAASADTTPTLGEWAETYITNLTGVEDGTRGRYRSYIRSGLGALPTIPIDAIDPTAIARWVNAQTKANLSAKTIANRHGFLSACLEAAVRAGHIKANPCKGTRLPKSERREMVFLTRSEFAILLDYIRPDSRDLVTVLANTGLRWGEITALRVGDWDPDHRLLTISRAWKFTGTNEQLVGAPKTSRSRRTIAVPSQVVTILRSRTAGRRTDELVFPGPSGGAWKASAFHTAVWQPAVDFATGKDYQARRAEWIGKPKTDHRVEKRAPWRKPAPPERRLTKRPRIHDLRHSCASWLIQRGVALPVVQLHLGHESIKTTVDRYGHLEPTHLAAVADALEDLDASPEPRSAA